MAGGYLFEDREGETQAWTSQPGPRSWLIAAEEARQPRPSQAYKPLTRHYVPGHYAFPNPAKGMNPTIRLQAGLADSVKVEIYDAAGRLAHSAGFPSPRILDDGNGKGPQHTYDYSWNAAGIGSGVYVCVVAARKSGQEPIVKTVKTAVIR